MTTTNNNNLMLLTLLRQDKAVTNKQSYVKTDRQTNKDTERERDKQLNKQTDRLVRLSDLKYIVPFFWVAIITTTTITLCY
jgi:hypothetical protein